MNEESRVQRNQDPEKYQKDIELFKSVALEGAEMPAYPGVVLRIREIWYRNRETISKEGANPADWNDAVMRDTINMINQDEELTWLGLPDMDEEGIKKSLSYFGIEV